ncbi:hypothetical protein HYV86_02430 [Candidatus Woesearchaeota archaeon]|nr:hypothetical protein [Candidatus Woesearchaeota archaeon]
MTQPQFERPTRQNVELGDLLLTGDNQFVIPVPITNIDDTHIYADGVSPGGGCMIGVSRDYGVAIVLKVNGTYLVGEQVPQYLPREKNPD